MGAALIKASFHVVLKLYNESRPLNLFIRRHFGTNEVNKCIAPYFYFANVLFLNAKLLGHDLRR